MTDFQIAVADKSPCTLRVSGEVDLAVADDLRQAGLSCIESDDVGLCVDLGDVTFIDSTGLGALVQLRTAARATASCSSSSTCLTRSRACCTSPA